MEAGRQADVAKTILSAKNVPYVVSAPTLIQEVASWHKDGIGGLQSVVMYALPELDGAIDTIPLGGLVKDDLYLCKERVIALGATCGLRLAACGVAGGALRWGTGSVPLQACEFEWGELDQH